MRLGNQISKSVVGHDYLIQHVYELHSSEFHVSIRLEAGSVPDVDGQVVVAGRTLAAHLVAGWWMPPPPLEELEF